MIYPTTLEGFVSNLDLATEHDHDGVQFSCTCVWPAAVASPDPSQWSTDGQDSDEDWDEEDSVTIKPPFWDGETVNGSGSSTPMASPMLATPRLQTVELLAEPSLATTQDQKVKASVASLSTAVKSSDIIESLNQWLKDTAAEQTAVVGSDLIAPSSTPSTGLLRISAENEALFAKLLKDELSAVNAKSTAAAISNRYVDRHHLAFDAIPFPTVDFETGLAVQPANKVRIIGRPNGSGRSGFCNSFREIARLDALRSSTVGGH